MKLLRILFVLALCLSPSPAQKKAVQVIWHPVRSAPMEGVYLHFKNLPSTVEVMVTVEGTAEGKTLPIARGVPDGDNGFLAAPIRDLDTYRMLRLRVEISGYQWEWTDPVAGKYYELGGK